MRHGALFRSILAALLAATLMSASTCDEDVGEGDGFALITSRVSVLFQDVEASGESIKPSSSADGRFVAFESDAPDLVSGDTNGKRDIFVKDRLLGTVDRVSIAGKGFGIVFQSIEDSSEASLSGDARFVAFESSANLATQSGGVEVVWRFDRQTVTTRHAHRSFTFKEPAPPSPDVTKPSGEASISADGRYIAFLAKGNMWDDTPAIIFSNPAMRVQVYVADLSTDPPTVMLASSSTASPTQGCDNDCFAPKMVLTPNGPAVAFHSRATDLHPTADDPGTTELDDVFLSFPVAAPGAPTIEVLSFGLDNLKAVVGCGQPSVSADGRYVAFRPTPATVTNFGSAAIVRRDRLAQPTPITEVFVTLLPSGSAAGRYIATPIRLSGDGRTIVFTEEPERVLPGVTLPFDQVFMADMGGTIHLVSMSTIGEIAFENNLRPAISEDGRWVFWDSSAANLAPGDQQGHPDVFARGPYR